MKKRIVILGNGIAGVSAASEIRRQRSRAEIVMVSQEHGLPYIRPLLSKACLRTFQKSRLAIAGESWYEKQQIRLIPGTQAIGLFAEEKKLLLETGETLDYDRCIYALGARPFLPPFAGTDKTGIAVLRTIEDVCQIRSLAALARHAVIIGGGAIGLEMAWQLSLLGCQTVILESGPRLLGSAFDEQSAQILWEQIQKKGILAYVGAHVKELTGREKERGHVGGVTLSDGRHFPADLVLISCGAQPNLDIARKSGLACGRGVLVNDYMETNIEGVYAAGDCIQWTRPNPGLWNYARISGEIAGYNALGPALPKPFSPLPEPVILNAMGISLYSIGDISEDGKERCVVRQEQEAGRKGLFLVNRHEGEGFCYRKEFYRENRLCGAVLIGGLSQSGRIKQQLYKEMGIWP